MWRGRGAAAGARGSPGPRSCGGAPCPASPGAGGSAAGGRRGEREREREEGRSRRSDPSPGGREQPAPLRAPRPGRTAAPAAPRCTAPQCRERPGRAGQRRPLPGAPPAPPPAPGDTHSTHTKDVSPEPAARRRAPLAPARPLPTCPVPSASLPGSSPRPVPFLFLPPGPAGSPAHLGGFLAGSGLQEPGDQVIELCAGTGRGTGEGDTVTKRADGGGAPAASATHRLPAGSGRPPSPSSSGGPRGRGGGGSRPAHSALLQRPNAHGGAPLPVRGVRPAAVLRRLHGIAVRPIDSPARRRRPPSWVQGAPPAARGRCGAVAGSGEAAGRKGRAVTRGGGPGRGEGALRPVGPGGLRVCVWKARENGAVPAPPRGEGQS